jgi:hypothetical protein
MSADLPKMIFFRSIRGGLPDFISEHLMDQIRCLRQFFNVIEITQDCDYDEVCDKYEPELALFESGVYTERRLIRKTSSHPEVRKLGFLHADAVDSARAAFISDMQEWGVETFFTHSVSMAEYTPAIADRLFVWPNFIDPKIFRDYNQVKCIPVLVSGGQTAFYPWRNAISRAVSAHFPTMICPHFGWQNEGGTHRMPLGEKYARQINSSIFVPACGSVTRDLVRKHLEIPAVGACLVTEQSAALESFGFQDMVNCVFATPENIVDKLDELLRDEDKLNRIVRAGHDLVHGRHTIHNRDQVRQWFDLSAGLGPGDKIVQDNPSGGLRISGIEEKQASYRVSSDGLDRVLLRKGWELIAKKRAWRAEYYFRRCLIHFFMAEALVGFTYCRLLSGDHKGAREAINRWLDVIFEHHKSKDPDPIAWATNIRVLVCAGDISEARAQAARFSWLDHEELNRMRNVLGLTTVQEIPGSRLGRPSIAPVPVLSQRAWTEQLVDMLKACNQGSLASKLAFGKLSLTLVPESVNGRESNPVELGSWTVLKTMSRKAAARLRSSGVATLRTLKRRLIENDDWSLHVHRLLQNEPISRAIVLNSSRFSRGLWALRRAVRMNPWCPQLIEINHSVANNRRAGSYDLAPGDLVYITTKGAVFIDLTNVCDQADVVIIDGIVDSAGYRVVNLLSRNDDFWIVHHDMDLDGHAIFRRRKARMRWNKGLLADTSLMGVWEDEASTASNYVRRTRLAGEKD